MLLVLAVQVRDPKSWNRNEKWTTKENIIRSKEEVQTYEHSQCASPASLSPSFEQTDDFCRDRRRRQSDRDRKPLKYSRVDRTAAATAAFSWVWTHVKLNIFGSRQIWVPAHRSRKLQNKNAKEFLPVIWTEFAAQTLNRTLLHQEVFDSIVSVFRETIFIIPQIWDGITIPFCRAANAILIGNLIWTQTERMVLLNLPLRSRMRRCLRTILEMNIPNTDDFAVFMSTVDKHLPPYRTKMASASSTMLNPEPTV